MAAGSASDWETVASAGGTGAAGGSGGDDWVTVSGGSSPASEKPKLERKKRNTLTGRGDPEGPSVSGFFSSPYGKLTSLAAGAEGVASAARPVMALMKGSVRPALGLVSSFAVGAGVDKLAEKLGAPSWMAEALALAAAAKTGERIGLTPEMRTRIKMSGVKGLLKDWLVGKEEASPSALEAFWQEAHPGEPLPPPGTAREQANAELKMKRKEIAQQLKDAASPEAQKAAKIKESAAAYRAEKGAPKRFDASGVKPADIPEVKTTPHAAPDEPSVRTPEVKLTAKEKIEQGRKPPGWKTGEGPKAEIPDVKTVEHAAPEPRVRPTKEKIEEARATAAEKAKTAAKPAAAAAPKPVEVKPAATEGAKPTARLKASTGAKAEPHAQSVSTQRSEADIGRFASNFASDRNAQLGSILIEKGLTPEQVAQLPEEEFYKAIGSKDPKTGKAIRKFSGKIDPKTGKAATQHRTFEQGRNDVVAWMLEQGKGSNSSQLGQ